MRTIRLSAVGGCIAAGLLCAAPAASALEGGFGGFVDVAPNSARPGATVTVRATGCIPENAEVEAAAVSAAFLGERIALRPVPGPAGKVEGSGTIAPGALAGAFQVQVSCDYRNQTPTMSTALLVDGARPPASPAPLLRGAHGGIGSSFATRGTATAVTGALLILLSAVLGLVSVLRRFSGSSGKD
jgi:hypothetical protein